MTASTCPGCGTELERHEDFEGRPARCSHCQHELAVADSAPSTQALVVAESPPPTTPPSGEDLPKPPLRRKRTARTVLVTCGIVATAFVVFCGSGATLVYFLFFHVIEEPLTAQDRGLFITAERLQLFRADLRIDPTRGKSRKVRLPDGGRELKYKYKSPKSANSVLYIQHMIGVDSSADGARGNYGGMGIGTNIGLRLGGENKNRYVERADLWSWGDASRCLVLYNGEAPVGNIFMGLKGRRYFHLAIRGVYFDNAEAIRELLQPFLKRLNSYEELP